MLTTAVVPLRLRSMAVLPSSESAKSNAFFSACTPEHIACQQQVNNRSRHGGYWKVVLGYCRPLALQLSVGTVAFIRKFRISLHRRS